MLSLIDNQTNQILASESTLSLGLTSLNIDSSHKVGVSIGKVKWLKN